ncbi:MAG: response regulator [Pirellulales bacterium]|nr:response regulator [Pirellulales bacterium]
MLQDIDRQASFGGTSLETTRRRGKSNSADNSAATPFSLQADALIATLGQTAKIMIVDDEPVNVKVVQKHLQLAGYQRFVTSTDPRPVLEMILNEMPDAILLDIMMPHVSGMEILRKVREDERLAHIPTIILTASDNEETKMEALELGAADFLGKPVNSAELIVRVRNALSAKAHHDRLKNYALEMEREVRRRTAELAASRLELLHCLARAAEFRDNETGRHVERVGRYAEIIARQLGMDEESVELIGHAAPLHDMGKIGIPDHVLLKPGKLTPDEMEIMRKHSFYGRQTFEPMSEGDWQTMKSHTFMGEVIMFEQQSPIMSIAAAIALTHHERWDGTGYPLGLCGEDIPLAGRITAVADVFDALSSKRPYKPALDLDRCFEMMEEGRGTQFDPNVVDAFLARREDVLQVYRELADTDKAASGSSETPDA